MNSRTISTEPAESPLQVKVEEAARLLGYGRSFVYQLIARNELPATKVGRTTRVPRKALDEWIAVQVGSADSDRPN